MSWRRREHFGECSLEAQLRIISHYLARLVGVSPIIDQSKGERAFSFLCQMTTFYCFVMGPLYHIYMNDTTLDEKTRGACIFLSGLTVVIKSSWLIIFRSKILGIINVARDEISTILPGSLESQIMEANMKRTKIISIVFTILLSLSCIFVFLDPVIRLHQLMPEVIFTLPGFNPRDQSPNYEISYVIFLISATIGCIAVSVNDVLFMTLVTHAKAEMEWIKKSLDLTDDSHLNTVYHYLKIKKIQRPVKKNMTKAEKADLKMFYIIEKHIGIMQYVKLVKDVYSTSLGGQFLTVSLCMGIILIQAGASSMSFNAVVTLNAFGDLVFYCHFGESLMTSGENLVFHGWDQLPKKSRLSLILFDNAMKRTLKLDAGGIYTLSNETLMNIIQKAYTIYNVFNNVNQP